MSFLSPQRLTGFLIGTPLIGFVAEHGGIRIGIACVVPFLLVSLFLTGRLAGRKPIVTNSQSPAIRA